jgi:predicted amidohydrolase
LEARFPDLLRPGVSGKRAASGPGGCRTDSGADGEHDSFDFVADVTVRSRAFENQCYVAYANYCGHEGDIQYCGQSSIAAPNGDRTAQAGLDEALIVGELDRQLMVDSRAANRYLHDRRPELYGALNKR